MTTKIICMLGLGMAAGGHLFAQIAQPKAATLLDYGSLGALIIVIGLIFMKVLPDHQKAIREQAEAYLRTIEKQSEAHQSAAEKIAKANYDAAEKLANAHVRTAEKTADVHQDIITNLAKEHKEDVTSIINSHEKTAEKLANKIDSWRREENHFQRTQPQPPNKGT